MNFITALAMAKEQLCYERYVREIQIGHKPEDDLPLLNALVNIVADVYACAEPTIHIANHIIATTKAQTRCRAITPAQCQYIIGQIRDANLQQSIQIMQFAVLREPLISV